MTTVKQVLYDAIFYEESLLAHALYISVQCGILKLEDPYEKMKYIKLPINEIKQATERNILKIDCTKLFAIRRLYHNHYVYYLSKDEESAINLHRSVYKEKPLKIIDQTEKLFVSIVKDNEPLSKARTFWDYKKHKDLPLIVCEVEAKKRVI